MNQDTAVKLFRDVDELSLVQILSIMLVAGLLTAAVNRAIPWIAKRSPTRLQLYLLPSVPVLRLLILVVAIASIVPLVIEPTLHNLVAILGGLGLAIGFAFKDYVSSIIAGIVAIYERPYRPGDWVKIDEAYGQVRSVGLRALQIVTPNDTVVTIPRAKIWQTNIYNATDGERDLQCVTDFYLDPHHEASLVRQVLCDVALTSPFIQLERPVSVLVAETPWGTHYRLKACPISGYDQFLFTTELTVRGKATLAALDIHAAPGIPLRMRNG
jgi:small conductance mechanosensitive channel